SGRYAPAAPRRLVVGADVLAEAAALVLDGVEPRDRARDRRMRLVEAERLERRQHRRRSVDVVHAPTSPPRAVVLLGVEQVLRAAFDGLRELGPMRGQGLERVRGDVLARRVDDGAEVAEGDPVEPVARVVGVERAPAAVSGLHAGDPVERAPAGVLAGPERAQRERDDGGVVEVGVVVVLVLEGPATGGEARTSD